MGLVLWTMLALKRVHLTRFQLKEMFDLVVPMVLVFLILHMMMTLMRVNLTRVQLMADKRVRYMILLSFPRSKIR